MTEETTIVAETVRLAVNVTPDPVDAGAKVTIRARAACDPSRDLRGQSLQFHDADGVLLGSAPFIQFDGRINETEPFEATAPLDLGEALWRVTLPSNEDDAPLESAQFGFVVQPQKLRLLVWDVPTAIVSGQTFAFKVGAKTSVAADLTGLSVEIVDHEGNRVAMANVTGDILPGTTGLHVADIEVAAPSIVGLHKWEARVAASDQSPAHGSASLSFGVRFVPEPECAVTVEATEIDGQTPIVGAHVVMHPYRALTDETGAARFHVPKGDYTVLVSKAKYEATNVKLAVADDVTTRTRLALEPPEDPDAHYV